MMTIGLIRRHVERRSYERLIQAVLANGRCGPRRFAARLCQPGAKRAAALGLALQRACELRTGLEDDRDVRTLVDHVWSVRRPDRRFGDGQSPDLVATAVAAAGLLNAVGLIEAAVVGEVVCDFLEQLAERIRGLTSLDAAVIVWQAAESPDLARAIRDAGLRDTLQGRAELLADPGESAFLHALAA